MVTGLSKAWIGINNSPNELAAGNNRKEVVLYDHTVALNINLEYSGSYGEYYQYIKFPNYTKAAGMEHYSYIYCEYTFIGDSVFTYPTDYNPNNRHAYANIQMEYDTNTAFSNRTTLGKIEKSNIGGTTFYFKELSGKVISITRAYGTYGYNTSMSSGTGTRNFNIYEDQYYLSIRLNYGYTDSTKIYNNQGVQHRVRIVGVI